MVNFDDLYDELGRLKLKPAEFEEKVAEFIRERGIGLSEFEVKRLEVISASDGDYEIDITARFKALDTSFLVLIECKYHKNPIKREIVQILYDKLRAVAGHKGMVFSTSRFQRGAIEFAQSHGIALIQLVDSQIRCDDGLLIPWDERDYIGQIISLDEKGNEVYRYWVEGEPEYLLERFNPQAT